MAYIKQNWLNLPNRTTPLSAQRLNHLETQYDESVAYTDDSVQQIINNSIEVQDPVVAGTVLDYDSDTYSALGDRITRLATSNRIIDLAREDGWHLVFDMGNPTTRTPNGISDGLGGDVILEETVAPTDVKSLGALTLENGAYSFTDPTISGTPTVMMVADYEHTGDNQYLIGGTSSDRHRLYARTLSNNIAVGKAASFSHGGVLTEGAHIFDARLSGYTSQAAIDSALAVEGIAGTNDVYVNNLTVGTFAGTDQLWVGGIGLVLVHNSPTGVILQRMRKLIAELTGIELRPLDFLSTSSRILSESRSGQVNVERFDADSVSGDTVRSITKMLNAVVAREYLTSDPMLDIQVEVIESDLRETEPLFQAGDIVSYRDLIYASAVPSNNAAPITIARTVGTQYITGVADGETKFMMKMNDYLGANGMGDSHVERVGGGLSASPRSTVKLIRKAYEDETLRTIFGTRYYDITIHGDNARVVTVETSANRTYRPFENIIMSKTGSTHVAPSYNLVASWTRENGEIEDTVILSNTVSPASRWTDFARVQFQVETGDRYIVGGDSKHSVTTMARGSGVLDITDLFTGLRRSSAQYSGLYLSRQGDIVMLYVIGVIFDETELVGSIPTGFRPLAPVYGQLTTSDNTTVRCRISEYGLVQSFHDIANTHYGTVMWSARPSHMFPATPLPGTPMFFGQFG